VKLLSRLDFIVVEEAGVILLVLDIEFDREFIDRRDFAAHAHRNGWLVLGQAEEVRHVITDLCRSGNHAVIDEMADNDRRHVGAVLIIEIRPCDMTLRRRMALTRSPALPASIPLPFSSSQ
jgi:hypothetical protein